MSMTTLLPCPFCGQRPTEYAIEPHTHVLQFAGGKMPDHQGSHVIECACGCGMIEATREAVAAVWNRRPTQAADAAVVLPEPAPTPCRSMFATQREYADAMEQHRKNWAEVEAERALLATANGLTARADRKWSCPVRTVADLANNLLTMDQSLPIYGAQYIEHPAGRRRAIAVPPTVSIERVKDSRWIGEGEELNTAIIWTRAEQPATPHAQVDARDAERYRWLVEDHASPETRKARNAICERLPVMSYSAACADIDAAADAAKEK